jgi:hypothetical protein
MSMPTNQPQGFKRVPRSHRIVGMSSAQIQFWLNRAAVKKQLLISFVSVAPKLAQAKEN